MEILLSDKCAFASLIANKDVIGRNNVALEIFSASCKIELILRVVLRKNQNYFERN
jgi:hypothetical protein